MPSEDSPASYRPSAFYWRRAIRNAADRDSLREIALSLVSELETHKAFIRELGYIPPKAVVHPDEAEEKGWAMNTTASAESTQTS